ncbi:hypothetical protein SKAU_G00220190 [Synaphobranchus kaupii]|uniref:Uncharacterized protein n=1 Tax=Synaphobranchus kaupii TaxID=118154 RepID=A0A9Q1IUX2_SYNKA|nr:hypothetical protein SKAU_G00220190 [Synaphobranchus kaupii]
MMKYMSEVPQAAQRLKWNGDGGGDVSGKTHLSLLQGFNLAERHAELTPSPHPPEHPSSGSAYEMPLCHDGVR